MSNNRSDLELPYPKTWWIDPGKIIGGGFPGTADGVDSEQRLRRLLDVGVQTVINLQVPGEVGWNGQRFPDYRPALNRLAAERGVEVEVHRFPITDNGVPTAARMQEILEALEHAVRAGRRVYVHCWGGHGRTGTVAGCWHVRCGAECVRALDLIEKSRRHDSELAELSSPQTAGQRAFVQQWGRGAAGA